MDTSPPVTIWAWFMRMQDGQWIGKTCTDKKPNVDTAVEYIRKPKWLPIDTAPTDGSRIIGLTPFGPEVVKWIEETYPDDVMGASVIIYDSGWIGVETDSLCTPSVIALHQE